MLLMRGFAIGQRVKVVRGHQSGKLATIVAVGVTDIVPTHEEIEKGHRDPAAVTFRIEWTDYVLPLVDAVAALEAA
jgi:hypothetical protein